MMPKRNMSRPTRACELKLFEDKIEEKQIEGRAPRGRVS